jgi:hypothetical protein
MIELDGITLDFNPDQPRDDHGRFGEGGGGGNVDVSKPWTPEKGMTLYHASESTIDNLSPDRPMWFTPSRTEASAYLDTARASSPSGTQYAAKLETTKIATQSDVDSLAKEVFGDNFSYTMLDPSVGEYPKAKVKSFIKTLKSRGFDGVIHNDYSAVNSNKDAYTLVVFNPKKAVSDFKKNSMSLSLDGVELAFDPEVTPRDNGKFAPGLRGIDDPGDVQVRDLDEASKNRLDKLLTTGRTPFPRVSRDDLPPVTNSKFRSEGKVEDVKVADLIATQQTIDQAQVGQFTDRYLRDVVGADDPVKVLRWNDKLYLIDGHHRATASWVTGDETIKATVVDR